MAAKGVNKVILVGRVGKDPEVRHMTNGKQVATISLATSENWLDNNGEKREATEWHRVVFFGSLADIVGKYVKKGGQLYVEGSLKTRKWQDQNGQERQVTEVVGSEMQMLGSPAQPSSQPAQAAARSANPPPAARPAPAQPPMNNFEDDDIPFDEAAGMTA